MAPSRKRKSSVSADQEHIIPSKRINSGIDSERDGTTPPGLHSSETPPNADSASSSALRIKPIFSLSPDEQQGVSNYVPNPQTFFFDRIEHTISWTPRTIRNQKMSVEYDSKFTAFENNIHSYFISEEKKCNESRKYDNILLYRHVGHVVLCNFHSAAIISGNCRTLEHIESLSRQNMDIDISNIVSEATCTNMELLKSINILSSNVLKKHFAPCIFGFAKSSDVFRACTRNNVGCDVVVDVYAGLPLFHIDCCRDVQNLIEGLVLQPPCTSATSKPAFISMFPRLSRSGPRDFSPISMAMEAIESHGYDELTPQQRRKIYDILKITLFRFQEQTVRWMLDKENDTNISSDFFWKEYPFTDTQFCKESKFYFHPLSGNVRLSRPIRIRGGIVAEGKGLGKTFEVLALIAAQKENPEAVEINIPCNTLPTNIGLLNGAIKVLDQNPFQKETLLFNDPTFHHGDEIINGWDGENTLKSIQIRRWRPRTTLIVCPHRLIRQWKENIMKVAPSLSVSVWSSQKSGGPTSNKIVFGPEAVDVVLASIETVQRDEELPKVFWQRLVIDEAHFLIRVAPRFLKTLVSFTCRTRFLLTGTPLVNSVDNLNGALAVLGVASLDSKTDKFWKLFVKQPFSCGFTDPLQKILNAVMMRHTRAQKLDIVTPSFTNVYIASSLPLSYQACYFFIYALCLDELESQHAQVSCTKTLQVLLQQMLLLCLFPSLVNVPSLQDIQQTKSSLKIVEESALIQTKIRKVSMNDALKFVDDGEIELFDRPQVNPFMDIGVNVDEIEEFMQRSLVELQNSITAWNLMSRPHAQKLSKRRLAELAAGMHKIKKMDTLIELQWLATILNVGTVKEVMQSSKEELREILKDHYRRLYNFEKAEKRHDLNTKTILNVYDSNENRKCPVCFADCLRRIALTKCGHIYCFPCAIELLGAKNASSGRCALCRFHLKTDYVVELIGIQCDESEKNSDESERRLKGPVLDEKKEARIGEPIARQHKSESVLEFPTAKQIWTKFLDIGAPLSTADLSRCRNVAPSLCPHFSKHLAAILSDESAPPKLDALRRLILESTPNSSICVVAGNANHLKGIARYLKTVGIHSIGDIDSSKLSTQNFQGTMSDSKPNSSIKPFVFLYHPTTLCITLPQVVNIVVFMETLLDIAQERQILMNICPIGQNHSVQIVRIVAKGTLEENIVSSRQEELCEGDFNKYTSTMLENESTDNFVLRMFGRGTLTRGGNNNAQPS